MQHEETDVKTHKHTVLACLIAAVCRNGPSHGQGGSRRHLRRPNWLLPRPNGLLIPPDRGSSPLFRVCPAGSWEQLWFPRVLINPAPPCISYNKQSKLNRLVYEDSRQLGWLRPAPGLYSRPSHQHPSVIQFCCILEPASFLRGQFVNWNLFIRNGFHRSSNCAPTTQCS